MNNDDILVPSVDHRSKKDYLYKLKKAFWRNKLCLDVTRSKRKKLKTSPIIKDIIKSIKFMQREIMHKECLLRS